MRKILALTGILGLLVATAVPASAGSISVAPTSIDMMAPSAASQLTLRNAAKRPVNVQVRVFRWSQVGGKEKLEPTNAVVASPPSAKMASGQEYVIRVVRVSKAPVQGEESYRVLVDELPQKTEGGTGMVNFVVRQSIPVFFGEEGVAAPDVTWSVARSGGRLMLTGRNEGGARLKLSDLALVQNGKTVAASKGLVGYVLGGSTMSFPINGKSVGGSVVSVQATSNYGPLKASASVKAK